MENEIKSVSYTSTNTYETLNTLTGNTKTIWLVFHGIGYLSKFFLRHFNELPQKKNYIIAPQAPSKYYLNGAYTHVGASWLTRENTEQEIKNLINYIDAVMVAEKIPNKVDLAVLGFSQGVSIALRYLAHSKLSCEKIILYAGGIPKELKQSDFAHLSKNTEIISIIGDKDPYNSSERLAKEEVKLDELFGSMVKQITFDGGHEVKKEVINKLVE